MPATPPQANTATTTTTTATTPVFAAMTAIANVLTAAELRAVLDVRDLNPPAVLVQTPVIRPRFGRGCWDADFTLLVVAPNTGPAPAARILSDLLPKVITTLAAAGIDVAVAAPGVIAQAADPSGPLPVYSLTFTTTIPA